MVLTLILSSLSNSVVTHVLFLGTTREVWTTLERLFSSQSTARVVQIRMHPSNLKKRDLFATVYFNKIKELADTLASIGQPLCDKEFISYLLSELDSEYESSHLSHYSRRFHVSK